MRSLSVTEVYKDIGRQPPLHIDILWLTDMFVRAATLGRINPGLAARAFSEQYHLIPRTVLESKIDHISGNVPRDYKDAGARSAIYFKDGRFSFFKDTPQMLHGLKLV